jgi:hypothetical protein
VFAVVQHQHGPFGTECRSQLTAADPAETESVRDRRHDTGGIERGGQRHPAHMKVSIGSQLPNDLHGEPRLAGTPDTADRDHTRRSEQVGELGAFPLASNEPSEIGRQRVPEELGIDRHSTFIGSSDPSWPPGRTPMIAPECIVARSPDVANGQLQPGPLSTRAARDWKALEAMRRCCDVGKSLAVPVFGQDAWFDRLHMIAGREYLAAI